MHSVCACSPSVQGVQRRHPFYLFSTPAMLGFFFLGYGSRKGRDLGLSYSWCYRESTVDLTPFCLGDLDLSKLKLNFCSSNWRVGVRGKMKEWARSFLDAFCVPDIPDLFIEGYRHAGKNHHRPESSEGSWGWFSHSSRLLGYATFSLCALDISGSLFPFLK